MLGREAVAQLRHREGGSGVRVRDTDRDTEGSGVRVREDRKASIRAFAGYEIGNYKYNYTIVIIDRAAQHISERDCPSKS